MPFASAAAQEAVARSEDERGRQRAAHAEHPRTHGDLRHCDTPLLCYQKRGLRFWRAAAAKDRGVRAPNLVLGSMR